MPRDCNREELYLLSLPTTYHVYPLLENTAYRHSLYRVDVYWQILGEDDEWDSLYVAIVDGITATIQVAKKRVKKKTVDFFFDINYNQEEFLKELEEELWKTIYDKVGDALDVANTIIEFFEKKQKVISRA